MKNRSTTWKRPRAAGWIAGAAAILAFAAAFAADVEEVSLGHDGAYDGQVKIERTESTAELVFTDAVAGSATLSDLKNAATAHGALAGLDGDHHPQYLNDARHAAEHDASFNNAMAAGPDPAGNDTLGGHLADASLHLRRDMPETVSGPWTFSSLARFAAGLKLSDGGSPGDASIAFEATSTGDAEILFDDSLDAFALNRDLLPVSILGVDAATYLHEASEPTLSETWTFDNGAVANAETTEMAGGFQTLQVLARAFLDVDDADGLDLVAGDFEARFDVEGSGGASSGNTMVGVYGRARLVDDEFGAGIGDMILTGVIGAATSQSETRQVGVAALAPNHVDGTSRVGLVAGIQEADYAGASLPAGGWSAYFYGRALFDGEVQAQKYVIQSGWSQKASWSAGAGSPEGSVAAPAGSLYSRLDGGAGTTLYVKESGTGTTGWAAK